MRFTIITTNMLETIFFFFFAKTIYNKYIIYIMEYVFTNTRTLNLKV